MILSDFVHPLNALTTRYEILRSHQLPIVHKLLYESFFVDEPMTRHLGLCQVWLILLQIGKENIIFFIFVYMNNIQGPHTVKDGDLMVENLVNNHNLSILATDR